MEPGPRYIRPLERAKERRRTASNAHTPAETTRSAVSTIPSNLPVTPPMPASNAASDPLVCFCRHVREGTLVDAIRDGCCSVEDLAARTRAGTGCATCRFDLLDLIARTTTRATCSAEGCAP